MSKVMRHFYHEIGGGSSRKPAILGLTASPVHNLKDKVLWCATTSKTGRRNTLHLLTYFTVVIWSII